MVPHTGFTPWKFGLLLMICTSLLDCKPLQLDFEVPTLHCQELLRVQEASVKSAFYMYKKLTISYKYKDKTEVKCRQVMNNGNKRQYG